MGGEVASVSDRSECEARTARPAFTERGIEKNRLGILKVRVAGNPQSVVQFIVSRVDLITM